MLEKEHILIVDDHPVVIEGLRSMLNSIRPTATVLAVSSVSDALRRVEHNRAIDWIVLDLNMQGATDLEFLTELEKLRLTANVVLFSDGLDPPTIDDALSLQVKGVLSKKSTKEIFERCLLTIEKGRVFLSSDYSQERKHYRGSHMLERKYISESLSARQLEVLRLLAKGFSNGEVAHAMQITQSTVKSHVSSLMNLFEASNRMRCVSEARRLTIIK